MKSLEGVQQASSNAGVAASAKNVQAGTEVTDLRNVDGVNPMLAAVNAAAQSVSVAADSAAADLKPAKAAVNDYIKTLEAQLALTPQVVAAGVEREKAKITHEEQLIVAHEETKAKLQGQTERLDTIIATVADDLEVEMAYDNYKNVDGTELPFGQKIWAFLSQDVRRSNIASMSGQLMDTMATRRGMIAAQQGMISNVADEAQLRNLAELEVARQNLGVETAAAELEAQGKVQAKVLAQLGDAYKLSTTEVGNVLSGLQAQNVAGDQLIATLGYKLQLRHLELYEAQAGNKKIEKSGWYDAVVQLNATDGGNLNPAIISETMTSGTEQDKQRMVASLGAKFPALRDYAIMQATPTSVLKDQPLGELYKRSKLDAKSADPQVEKFNLELQAMSDSYKLAIDDRMDIMVPPDKRTNMRPEELEDLKARATMDVLTDKASRPADFAVELGLSRGGFTVSSVDILRRAKISEKAAKVVDGAAADIFSGTTADKVSLGSETRGFIKELAQQAHMGRITDAEAEVIVAQLPRLLNDRINLNLRSSYPQMIATGKVKPQAGKIAVKTPVVKNPLSLDFYAPAEIDYTDPNSTRAAYRAIRGAFLRNPIKGN